MIAVIYEPTTGKIISCIQSAKINIEKSGPYIEVTEFRDDYDTDYEIVDGKLRKKS